MNKLLIVLALLIPGFALAHDAMHLSDWIRDDGLKDPADGSSCCGENDCKPLPKDAVSLVPAGYHIIPTNETIPSKRVLWKSKDGQWWRCAPLEWNGQRSKTRCLIGPPQSY